MPERSRSRQSWGSALGGAALWALVPMLVLLAACAVAAGSAGVPLGDLVREATYVARAPVYTGGLAATGVGLWVAAAAVALFSTLGQPWRNKRLGELVVVLGLLSVVLALDDQFRLHEDVLPALGLPEETAYVAYALALALVRARDAVLQRADTTAFVLAVVLLAMSVGVDLVQQPLQDRLGLTGGARVYLEDGLKLCGAAVWLRWVAALSRDVPASAPVPAAA